MESKPVLVHVAFAVLCLFATALARNGLQVWLEMSQTSEQSSNLWLIPLISAFLIFERRHAIFANTRFTPTALLLFPFGLLIDAVSLSTHLSLSESDAAVLAIVGFWITVMGAFIACYGKAAWSQAKFPLGFLLFAVPMPQVILDPIVRWLQHGSAAVVNSLFVLLHVSFLRDGLDFYLSGLTIAIAPECSGIRSSYALLVLTVLLSHLTLRTTWHRVVLVLAVVPLVLLKNGIRIVTLCLLTLHVDRSVITGPLHHQGGFVFFGLALFVEGALCWLLQRSEVRERSRSLLSNRNSNRVAGSLRCSS